MPPLAVPHTTTESRGLHADGNHSWSHGLRHSPTHVKRRNTVFVKGQGEETMEAASARSAATAEQPSPRRGRARKVGRQRSSSLSAMDRHHRVGKREEIPQAGAFASLRAQYLVSANNNMEPVYSHPKVTKLAERRSSICAPRGTVPHRTRSRSLTQLDQRKVACTRSLRKPTAVVRTSKEDTKGSAGESSTAVRKSWAKPKQTDQEEETTVSAEKVSRPVAMKTWRKPTQTEENGPNQAPNTSSRTVARKSWKKPTEVASLQEGEKKTDPVADVSLPVARKSWRKPTQTQAAYQEQTAEDKSSHTAVQIQKGGEKKTDPVVDVPQPVARKSWRKPTQTQAAYLKQAEDKSSHGAADKPSLPTRGRDVASTEKKKPRPEFLTTLIRLEDASKGRAALPWLPSPAPTRQRVRRARSRSLTSLRKERAEDGTIRTYLAYSNPNRWRSLKDRVATRVQSATRGYLQRRRWILQKPWLQKRKINREKTRELSQIEKQKNDAMRDFKYELEDQEWEREKKLKALLKEKASLEKQVQIQKDTKKAIQADIRKEKQEEERLKERKRTDSVCTMLYSSAVTGIHVQETGAKQQISAYGTEIDSVKRELVEVQQKWDQEKRMKRKLDRCMRSIIVALKQDPSVDAGLVDFLVRYSGVDI